MHTPMAERERQSEIMQKDWKEILPPSPATFQASSVFGLYQYSNNNRHARGPGWCAKQH